MKKVKEKPVRQPRRRPGIERYNRIVNSAEELILEAGSLNGITLDAVAKRAGVPRVSLYYFFDSVESLFEALYQRGVQRMIAELPQTLPIADWRDVLSLYVDSVRDFYLANRVEMILALLPVSLVAVNKVSREFGPALFRLLHAQGLVPRNRQVMVACEIVSELADLVWRKSLIEKGTLTPAYNREVKRLVVAYFAAVLSDHESP
jgi:AcrR family transcriptional regulator